MDSSRKPLATLARPAMHGRTSRRTPPRGPISRVSSNLLMRRPAEPPPVQAQWFRGFRSDCPTCGATSVRTST